MATSGTVGATVVSTRQLMDQAFRRAKIPPPKISREDIHVAKVLIHQILSGWANRGLSLWALQTHILPMYDARATVPCPRGTIDTLNTNIRQLTRFEGTASASEGTADNAFDEDIETDCTQVVADGWIRLTLDEAAAATNFGILFADAVTVSFIVEYSLDAGATWVTAYTETDYSPAGLDAWFWFDVEGLPAAAEWRLSATDGTLLNVAEFVIANNPSEIPIAKINRDDYMNLPNKQFTSRPTSFYYDKQFPIPNIVLWPPPSEDFTFWQITATTQRLIQDVGDIKDELELPAGGQLALVACLAYHLAGEMMEAKMSQADLAPEMSRALTDFWAGQTDSSPSRLAFNISPYTR